MFPQSGATNVGKLPNLPELLTQCNGERRWHHVMYALETDKHAEGK